MIFDSALSLNSPLARRIGEHYRADESAVVDELIAVARLPTEVVERITERARALVAAVRRRRIGGGGLDAFLHEYELSTREGVVLMCLAEALLRIPDADTADRLIRDKLGPADWERHLGHSESLFVNASTWALMLTGRIVALQEYQGQSVRSVLGRLVGRMGEPVIRQSVVQAMRILGRQFVMGRTIEEAIERGRDDERAGYRHSYDMLGEAARTAADAERYFDAYTHAIAVLARAGGGRRWIDGPGVSIKLSALHPRYEFAKQRRLEAELLPRLTALAQAAQAAEIGFTIDAEEADRLEISLGLFEALCADRALAGWDGLGIAVQTYQKRALPVIDWLADLALRHRRRIMLRLTKGAYWDAEIKRAQERGLDGYPVFTRKVSTDVSYLACARRVLDHAQDFYPQFATHNAHTLAAVVEMAGDATDYEFQRLHGMGEVLYEEVRDAEGLSRPCRIYAPVGSHEDLLAYLVRRLLENGANTSFVNRIIDEDTPVDEIVADPVGQAAQLPHKPHPRIPLPRELYGPSRANSAGIDLSDPAQLRPLADRVRAAGAGDWRAGPIIGGVLQTGTERPLHDPADRRRRIGCVVEATAGHVEQALVRATRAADGWDLTPAATRAACLDEMANALEQDMPTLMAMAMREAGKTVADAVAEVREAVDFCRYYAAHCRTQFGAPLTMDGPTGEDNRLSLHGRGTFACISPWNFPLAIFTGQIAAALAAGNAVVAKPAEQTPLIAARAVRLFHEAGIPGDVLQLLPGDGPGVGAPLVADPRIAGVAFTGSTDTARAIARALAAKQGPIVPLIAETGGQNVMLVDSSALPEQVVADAVSSAFQSAGQRCSALRVLFLQSDVADRILTMLRGAMAEIEIGDPASLAVDVGPVIDGDALQALERHAARMAREARLIYECHVAPECKHGTYFAPRAFEIDAIDRLEREVFGPILHVIRFDAKDLDDVIAQVNRTGYGLTLGIHSRIDDTVEHIRARVKVGNIYVNRNQIGAVVGVQPFGGEGLSGTGPKAGGPNYLKAFATERTLSINTTAQGGNAALMSLQDDIRGA